MSTQGFVRRLRVSPPRMPGGEVNLQPPPEVPRVIPLWLASMVSAMGELKGKLVGRPPLIPRGQLQFLQVDSYPSATRATDELGLRFTPLSEGLARTVAWLRATGRLPHA